MKSHVKQISILSDLIEIIRFHLKIHFFSTLNNAKFWYIYYLFLLKNAWNFENLLSNAIFPFLSFIFVFFFFVCVWKKSRIINQLLPHENLSSTATFHKHPKPPNLNIFWYIIKWKLKRMLIFYVWLSAYRNFIHLRKKKKKRLEYVKRQWVWI